MVATDAPTSGNRPPMLPDDDVALVLSPAFFVERLEETAATICLRSNGARLRIPNGLFSILMRFREPIRLRRLVADTPALAGALPAIETMRGKGFLVAETDAHAPPKRRDITDPPVRLFDSPAHRLVPAEADVLVFGVPWDEGDRAASGARNGPLAIRDASLQILYGVDRFSGRPLGWFDTDRGRGVLAGVSIGDCGDVFVDHGEPQAAMFARLTSAFDAVFVETALPVLLGGDATICVPIVERLQTRMPIAVVRIGGPAQRDDIACDRYVGASALARRFASLPGVSAQLHLCPRRDSTALTPPSAIRTIPLEDVRRDGVHALRAHLSPEQPVYLGLDIGVLQTPGTGNTVDGLDYATLHALLCALGAHARIVGFDLVGLKPNAPCWNATAMTALHLLMTGLSAAKDRHAPF